MRKYRDLTTLAFCLSVGLILVAAVRLEAQDPKQDTREEGRVSIPWNEFRNLLQLGRDEIVLSWDEFQAILNQTGGRYVPPFQMKDEKVVLTREQFKKLLAQMVAPTAAGLTPPADFLLTKAEYRGKMQKANISLQAEFRVEIFPRTDRREYVKIQLFPESVALKEVLFDDKRALVILENGSHTVATSETGAHRISVLFSLKTPPEQEARAFSFPIPRTPITTLELEIPMTGIGAEVGSAQQLELAERGGGTTISAVLAPSEVLSVSWRKELPEVAKGPAKLYSDTLSHIRVEDDALRVTTDITLTVLQNTISALTLGVPDGYTILDVQGGGLGDWRELKRDGHSFLEIPLEFPKKGNLTLSVTAEKILPESSMAVDFTGFSVVDSIRDKGFLGVELRSASEASLTSNAGLDVLDVSELPTALINRSQKPLLFGFKYLRHPYSLVLDVKKHQEVPVISTVIDSVSGVTLFTEDGKVVHRVLYKIRNTSKQFLTLELPEKAQIWSVFVAGEPARPRVSEKKILVPLNRSPQGATGLTAFDIELIYYEKKDKFERYSSRESLFPVPDVIISQVLWSVYLPVGYTYFQFGGTLEKEKMTSGIRPFLGLKREVSGVLEPAAPAAVPAERAGKDDTDKQRRQVDELKKQFSPNLALEESQLAQQVANEAQFSSRVQAVQGGLVPTPTGALPIRINIPTTGQIYRFAKNIVSEEPLTVRFRFVSQETVWLFQALAVLVLALVLYLLRGPLRRLYRALRERVRFWHGAVLFLILAVLSWAGSRPLSVLCFLGFLLMLILAFLKRRRGSEVP